LTFCSLESDVVWGVNKLGEIYYRDGPGGSWTRVSGTLKQIDIGALGVIGVCKDNDIYYRLGTRNNPHSTGSGWQK